MNALYLVSVKNVPYIAEYIACMPRFEIEDLVELVIAPNPGKAKSLFWKIHKSIYIGWNDIHTMKIVPIDLDPQIVPDQHPLYGTFWELTDEKIKKIEMCSKIGKRE